MILSDERLEATAQFLAHEDPAIHITHGCNDKVTVKVRGADFWGEADMTFDEMRQVMTRLVELRQ